MYNRAHHTCKKQGDLTSPSKNMREKSRHDRETSNSFIETCFRKKSVVSSHHLKKNCIWSVPLLISFIHVFNFMFCTCITIVDLIFVDFLFYLSCIEICKMYITSKCSFSSIICMFKIWQSWLLYTFEKATNNSSCAKIIKKKITQSNNQCGTGSI